MTPPSLQSPHQHFLTNKDIFLRTIVRDFSPPENQRHHCSVNREETTVKKANSGVDEPAASCERKAPGQGARGFLSSAESTLSQATRVRSLGSQTILKE